GGLPKFSADGSTVVFLSYSDELVPGDFNSFTDVFSYSNLPSVQSVQVADGSAQPSVIPSLAVAFDQLVTFPGGPAAAFELKAVGSGQSGVVSLTASVVNNTSGSGAAPTTVTLTFSGPLTQFGSLIDGDYQLRVLASHVSGAGPLDGNNDGFAGDDYTFSFHRFFGDTDGDRDVDAADFLAFRGAFLGITPYNPALDFDGNGSVDVLDFLQFHNRYLLGSI